MLTTSALVTIQSRLSMVEYILGGLNGPSKASPYSWCQKYLCTKVY